METNRVISKLNKQIEAENETFNAMSKNEKKVVVAQDCIARIKAKQIVANCGLFIENVREIREIDDSLKTILNNPTQVVKCKTCAKGSLFMSYIGRTNDFKSWRISGFNSIKSDEHIKLLEIFTEKELSYIELAYEGSQYLKVNLNEKPIRFTKTEITKARKFYIKHGGQFYGKPTNDTFGTDSNRWNPEENEKRLLAICKNIIRNKGEFILK